MCGIAGILSLNRNAVDLQRLERMTHALAHRGPDGEGFWISEKEELGLGHRRLSVIDLSEKAAQPMHYEGLYTISYNGEIYNYPELKSELEDRGLTFQSETDTEVLLAGYHAFGEKILDRLDGMFAFAIWDHRKELLFCARDRFGEKPFFYFHDAKNEFCFASEIKALGRVGAAKGINEQMLFYYLNYDVVEISHQKKTTFYSNIWSLPAGHLLKIGRDHPLEIKPYWKISQQDRYAELSFNEACDKFHELLSTSVARRLRSDVPVGSSLSGGLDSSSIVVIMHRLLKGSEKQQTFSARFSDPLLDEGKYIELITQPRQILAHQIFPDPSTLENELEKLFYHQEQPFGSASIFAQWEVMKKAKEENVTVLLDGQGADEILAGYPRYFRSYFKELYRTDRKLYKSERQAYDTLHPRAFTTGRNFFLEAHFPVLLQKLGHWKRRFSSTSNYMALNGDFYAAHKSLPTPFEYFNTLHDDLLHSTVQYGLEKLLRFSDRNAMAFSREVRLPYLSHELVEFVFSLPSAHKLHKGWTKYLLRKSMEKELPHEISHRADKTGFEPPQKSWMETPSMKKRIEEARMHLTDEKILAVNASVSDWQALMADQLIKQSSKWAE